MFIRWIGWRSAAALAVALALSVPPAAQPAVAVAQPAAVADSLWLAPQAADVAARARLATAVTDLAEGRAEAALAAFSAEVNDSLLGGFARLHVGRAELALERSGEALRTARQVLQEADSPFLAEAAAGLGVTAAVALKSRPEILRAWQDLASVPGVSMPATLLGLARAALDAGDRPAALTALTALYYDHPASTEGLTASIELTRLKARPARATAETHARDLARAERLFSARQYAPAREAFEFVRPVTTDADRAHVHLRLAQTLFHLKRFPAALAALKPEAGAGGSSEAEYYHLSTLRDLGRTAEYVSAVRRFSARDDAPAFVERALNELGTHYILASDDEKAAGVFADMYRRYPIGAFADRAAWKAGWWAYRTGDYDEAARIFESAAAGLRRADNRPAWLYWAARAHLHLGRRDAALLGFGRVVEDYRNSYYGREAIRRADAIDAATRPAGAGPVSPVRFDLPSAVDPGPRPGRADLIVALLAAGMYDEAIGEVRRVQASGNTPLLDATIAFAHNRQGRLRPAITAMRRAYPEFMAAGGEALPREILTVIFPIDHWPLLRQHAEARRIDPWLLAALVAQESTFQADVRSSAGAIGLMQIIPGTGQRFATALAIRPFQTQRLTEPEINVRIGTTYLAQLLAQFGDVASALACYNAGEHRVVRWLADRRGLERDEFVDDIPFPETQFYVKRILGTAEDYRILYGDRLR
jgi:soluble lytic murein transglycosylase